MAAQSNELTVTEAATFLGVGEETVRRHVRARKLPAEKKGLQWFIKREDLQVFASTYDPKTGKRRQLF